MSLKYEPASVTTAHTGVTTSSLGILLTLLKGEGIVVAWKLDSCLQPRPPVSHTPPENFSFRTWQQKLLHKCFTVNSMTQLCGNFCCQIVKEKSFPRIRTLGLTLPAHARHLATPPCLLAFSPPCRSPAAPPLNFQWFTCDAELGPFIRLAPGHSHVTPEYPGKTCPVAFQMERGKRPPTAGYQGGFR